MNLTRSNINKSPLKKRDTETLSQSAVHPAAMSQFDSGTTKLDDTSPGNASSTTSSINHLSGRYRQKNKPALSTRIAKSAQSVLRVMETSFRRETRLWLASTDQSACA